MVGDCYYCYDLAVEADFPDLLYYYFHAFFVHHGGELPLYAFVLHADALRLAVFVLHADALRLAVFAPRDDDPARYGDDVVQVAEELEQAQLLQLENIRLKSK